MVACYLLYCLARPCFKNGDTNLSAADSHSSTGVCILRQTVTSHQRLLFLLHLYNGTHNAVAGGKMRNGLSASSICSHRRRASCSFGPRELLSAKCFMLLYAVLLSCCLLYCCSSLKILIRCEGNCPQMTLSSIACWIESMGCITAPNSCFL